MLSVILPRWDDPPVIEMTRDNIQNELRSVVDAELIVANSWLDGLNKSRTDFVCLIEPDCLVSSGYFSSNLSLFLKNKQFRKLAMVSSAIGLNNWGNKIYGYHMERVTYGKDDDNIQTTCTEIQAFRERRSSSLFPVQVGFLPGAIVRRSAMQAILQEFKKLDMQDLVKLSTDISFYLWSTGRRVYVNPNTTYVSTDRRLENPDSFKWKLATEAEHIFEQEFI